MIPACSADTTNQGGQADGGGQYDSTAGRSQGDMTSSSGIDPGQTKDKNYDAAGGLTGPGSGYDQAGGGYGQSTGTGLLAHSLQRRCQELAVPAGEALITMYHNIG